MALQTAQPQPGMVGGAPPRTQLIPEPPRRLGEGRHRLGPPLLGQGVATLAGQLPVRERLLAGLLQRDQRVSAEPALGSAAPDREALNPAPAPRGPDIEIKAVPVAVSSGPAHVADEGRRERVVRMLATRLAFRRSSRERHTHHYISHNVADARGRQRTPTDRIQPYMSIVTQCIQATCVRYETCLDDQVIHRLAARTARGSCRRAD